MLNENLEINQWKGIDILLILGQNCVIPENEKKTQMTLVSMQQMRTASWRTPENESLRRDDILIKRRCPRRKNELMTWGDTKI